MPAASSFGDFEPEDAWDASDPVEVKLTNLERRLDLVEENPHAFRNVQRLIETEEDLENLTTRERSGPVIDRVIAIRHRIEAQKRGED